MAHARLDRLPNRISRQHLAELTSTLGAGVLGVGLGILLSRFLQGLGVAILLVGALMHGWGMIDRMRLDKAEAVARPAWSVVLYWLCWALLAVLVFFLVVRAVR